MVERTTWSIRKSDAHAVDTLHIRYMQSVKKKCSKTAFLRIMINMSHDMIDILEDREIGPVVKNYLQDLKEEATKV